MAIVCYIIRDMNESAFDFTFSCIGRSRTSNVSDVYTQKHLQFAPSRMHHIQITIYVSIILMQMK